MLELYLVQCKKIGEKVTNSHVLAHHLCRMMDAVEIRSSRWMALILKNGFTLPSLHYALNVPIPRITHVPPLVSQCRFIGALLEYRCAQTRVPITAVNQGLHPPQAYSSGSVDVSLAPCSVGSSGVSEVRSSLLAAVTGLSIE